MSPLDLRHRFGIGALTALFAFQSVGCAPEDDGLTNNEADPDAITGANAVGRTITIRSYVYVRVGATDREVQQAAVNQIRPLFGALKAFDIGLGNRLDTPTAPSLIDATTFQRDTVNVIDPMRPDQSVGQMQRVRFTYSDRATVHNRYSSRRAFPTVALFGDYNAHSADIINNCQSEHRDWGASGIWYNYEPHLSACDARIKMETSRIDTERRQLRNPDREITVSERDRWFLPLSLSLKTIARSENKYPDYHRMLDDNRVVIGSFFGEDKHDDPNDYGARNYFTYIREVLRVRPELRVTATSPTTDLTTVTFNGQTVSNVTPQQVAGWIVDNTGYPSFVTDRNAFRLQVIRQWRDKLVTLSTPATMTVSGMRKSVTLEVRVFIGDEESWSGSSAAVQRYKRAFQEVDVFQYTGHSHLGSGALDARNYAMADFPNRYQIMMVNSCVSFNYYNTFFEMHPGGTRNLDTVTNGLPVYLEGSGLSSARFAAAFLDGRYRSYSDVLVSMRVNLPWEPNHDANRVADGEPDNEFSPSRFPITLSVPARP